MLPPPGSSTLQVTPVLLVPVTAAVKVFCPPEATVAELGETVTVIVCGPDPGQTEPMLQSTTSEMPPVSLVGDIDAVFEPVAPADTGLEAVMLNPALVKLANLQEVTADGSGARHALPSTCS